MKIFRQGDVLLREISKVPRNAKRITTNKNRIVLAFGEVTGHAHAIADVDACEVFETENERILTVIGRPVEAIRCRNIHNDGICWIPADRDPAQYKDLQKICVETVNGVVLSHEEHLPFVITAGNYQAGGSGKHLTQREYSPEAIRNVAD